MEFSFKILIFKSKVIDSKSKRLAMEYKKNTQVGSLHQDQKKKENSRDTFDVSKINLGRVLSNLLF